MGKVDLQLAATLSDNNPKITFFTYSKKCWQKTFNLNTNPCVASRNASTRLSAAKITLKLIRYSPTNNKIAPGSKTCQWLDYKMQPLSKEFFYIIHVRSLVFPKSKLITKDEQWNMLYTKTINNNSTVSTFFFLSELKLNTSGAILVFGQNHCMCKN